MDIVNLIKKRATEKIRKILLIEGEDERIIKAAALAANTHICEPTLLGRKTEIIKQSAKNRIDLNGVGILEYKNHPKLEEFAKELVEIRKHKGLKLEEAKELLKNPNYFGALMIKLGKFDGAVGGCKFSTAEWMRPVFQIIGSKEKGSLISACVIIPIKDKVYFFSDTDFNIKPDKEQLAQIAINAADFAEGIGIEPKVALLSYSTKGSGEHPCLDFIRDAYKIIRDKRPDIAVDGELQVDAAISKDAAKKKCPDSPLKGDANILIFPDITVGNVLLHAVNQWMDVKVYGSFPIGLAKPVMNGGRSFTAEQICDLITACAMQANI